MAHLASAVKTEWRIDPEALTNHASVVAKAARRAAGNLRRLRSLPPEADALLWQTRSARDLCTTRWPSWKR